MKKLVSLVLLLGGLCLPALTEVPDVPYSIRLEEMPLLKPESERKIRPVGGKLQYAVWIGTVTEYQRLTNPQIVI